MTPLPKTMAKYRPSAKPNKLYFLQNILLLNVGHCVKSYWHFCQILAHFTMPSQQIWLCQVTQIGILEKFLSCPNSTFNIRKKHKISSGKALYFRSYQPKTSWGGGGGGGREHPLNAFRVNILKIDWSVRTCS